MLNTTSVVPSLIRRSIAVRQFHDNFKWPPKIKLKWEKNPVYAEPPATQWSVGHPDDPEYCPPEVPYKLYPEKGDKPWPVFVYRTPLPGMHRNYLDRLLSKWFAALIWGWLIYHIYYHYGDLLGHAYMPYLHEFTDEELGIPPDDAPDPTPEQYWGNHGKPYRSYR